MSANLNLTEVTWFAELQAKGQAPDFDAHLKLRVPEKLNLRHALEALDLQYFKPIRYETYDLYVDQADYDAYLNQTRSHFFVLNTVSVTQSSINFTRSNGGYSIRDYLVDEMRVFDYVLRESRLLLPAWTIWNSGDGLRGDLRITGGSKRELRHYFHSIRHY